MTRKSQARAKRNKDMIELYKRLPVEEIAKKHKLHIATVYKIVRKYDTI